MLCALGAVLAVALSPAAAQARVDAGRTGTEQPRLWGVEVGKHAKTFARAAYLARLKHAGVNAVVVDPRRFALKELRATVKSASRAGLWVVEVLPPAHAKPTRSVRALRATCRAQVKPNRTLCATSASLSSAMALSHSSSAGTMVAVRLAGPAEVEKLRSVSSSGLQILALVKLRAHRYATSAWRKAIAVAATTSSLNLAVTPTSASNQTLSPYLNQLGKPPSAPPSFAVTGSGATTVSVAWAPVVGATEYDLTTNGAFAGKTATTSFTLGGLACNTTYKLAVTAKNTAGKTSKASTLTTSTASCSDVTPPTAPTGLTEVSSSQTSATVAWASSTDNVAVAGYTVSVDGASVATTSTTSYSVGGLTCGSAHTVAVDAFDSAGNHSTRASMTASTSACPDTTPPTVAVTAPGGGATVSGTVSVTATASDNVGVASVEFWVDGTKVATDTSTPYTYSWDTTQVASGAHTILVKAVDTSNNTASTTVGVTVSNSPCVTSSTSWQNSTMLSPDGTFDVAFDATPSATDIDAVTGLSATTALSYNDLAVIARFNSTGVIDAINGGGYSAANTVPYSGGATYHFRAAVNVPSHTYSLYVTAPGKPEAPVALNYAFRTGQGSVSALSDWAVTAADGSHQTCGLAVTNPADMTAPSAPTSPTKTSSTQTSLSASWTASTDNVGVAGYTVYVNGTASSAPTGTSQTISNLSCGTTYTIGVDAYDAAGNHSAQTTTTMSTSACPGDTTPPSTPTNLNQSGSTATSATVSWTASTDNVGVTGYTLYVNGAQVGTTTGTSAAATGLTCGTAYTLAVDAFDAAGNHSTKASISASTAACPGDTSPPSTPTGLATSAVGQTSATLSWTASTDNVGVTGYRLYLGTSQVGTSSSTSYVFSGLSCGTGYTLGVAAVDAAGNVSGTATLAVTTTACSSGGGSSFACYGAGASCYTPLACTTTISSGLQTAIANAAAGAVICLSAAGSPYPTLSTSAVKSADVTIQAAPGAAVSIGGLNLTGTSHLVFQNLTSTGASVYGATHTHLRYISFTGSSLACTSSSCGSGVVANADVSFEHDRFDNIQNGTYEARLAFRGQDNNITASGFTVSDSHFGGTGLNGGWGGCSDGVGLVGSVTAVTIGPGNEFDHLQQGSCGSINGAHVDPIQFYGATNTLVTGNWFHNNGDGSGGIMSPDGDDGYTVSNNVFDQTGMYAYAVDVEGCSGCTVSHNVIRNANVFAGVSNGGSPTSNLIVRDNLFQNGGIGSEGSATYTASYNLNCSCSGLGNITGTPIYTGGTNPTTYGGFHLASGSPGKGSASDGTDIGIP